MFNICLECVKLFNIAVHNYDVFRFKFVHIHYTDKLYCLKLIKVKLKCTTASKFMERCNITKCVFMSYFDTF